MIVLKQLFSFVIYKAISDIEFESKYVVQSLVVLALLVDFSEDCLAEVICLKRKHFGVECAREQLEP